MMEHHHLAAASGHLHLAAAAHYFAEARAGRAPRRAEEPSIVDPASPGGDGDSVTIDVDDDGSVGGGSGDDDGGEELEWTMQDLYDLLLLLTTFVPPAPAYKALPQDVVQGLAWTWVIIVYGVFLAVAVTTFSVRVFGTSTRCLPTFLRVLLLTVTVVSEVFAAVYMMPATTLTVVGTCFTVLLLVVAHLVACRRHR